MTRSHSVITELGSLYTTEALASAFVAATGEDKEAIVELLTYASRQLQASGHPGAWHRFDAKTFFASRDAGRHARVGMAMRLLGFFHWLWLVGLVEDTHASSISAATLAAAPDATLLDDLHANLMADRLDWVRDELPN